MNEYPNPRSWEVNLKPAEEARIESRMHKADAKLLKANEARENAKNEVLEAMKTLDGPANCTAIRMQANMSGATARSILKSLEKDNRVVHHKGVRQDKKYDFYKLVNEEDQPSTVELVRNQV